MSVKNGKSVILKSKTMFKSIMINKLVLMRNQICKIKEIFINQNLVKSLFNLLTFHMYIFGC